MKRLPVLFLLLLALPAWAWNGAGHRLVAAIAWESMSPAARAAASELLAAHPDFPRWQGKGKDDPVAIFAEAATWADDIRRDPRYYDEERETPTPALPGLADTARHKRWHYVDRDGRKRDGELDRQLPRLIKILRSTGKKDEKIAALPWLLHLVGDAHQPLHVGQGNDNGGNEVEIENPFNPRLPFTSLHAYWDDLPGPPWLRGARLAERRDELLASQPLPDPGGPSVWLEESRKLHAQAYPALDGSLLPIIDEAFHARARAIADRRLAAAGRRLGEVLEAAFAAGRSLRRQQTLQ